MEQTKIKQERSRKYGGSSSFLNNDEPSEAPDSVDAIPKQVGGNRGGV